MTVDVAPPLEPSSGCCDNNFEKVEPRIQGSDIALGL
jgi:hypothetical protein